MPRVTIAAMMVALVVVVVVGPGFAQAQAACRSQAAYQRGPTIRSPANAVDGDRLLPLAVARARALHHWHHHQVGGIGHWQWPVPIAKIHWKSLPLAVAAPADEPQMNPPMNHGKYPGSAGTARAAAPPTAFCNAGSRACHNLAKAPRDSLRRSDRSQTGTTRYLSGRDLTRVPVVTALCGGVGRVRPGPCRSLPIPKAPGHAMPSPRDQTRINGNWGMKRG